MTSIFGESGCGKSTVVNMIVGAYRPKSGSVTVGGKKCEEVTRESYYSHLAVVSYNTYIFNQTVRENFYLANADVSDEEIYASLEKVNLASFIRENGGDGADLGRYADSTTPEYREMVEYIRRCLNLTSIAFQTLDDLVQAIGLPREKLCTYCWTGEDVSACGGGCAGCPHGRQAGWCSRSRSGAWDSRWR